MRVVHLSTYDVRGGAARAAHRLHRGLLAGGTESTMIVRRKSSHDETVQALEIEDGLEKKLRRDWRLIQRHWIDCNRTDVSNTLFSAAYPGRGLCSLDSVRAADVLHVHWTWWFVGIPGIAALAETGKPVVWTFHDQRAFTGGCHFSAGCRGYESDCPECPQLRDDPLGITRAALRDAAAIRGKPVTIVCPSRWLASCARGSRLFGDARVEVIPYGVDADTFGPRDREKGRHEFNLPGGAVRFLFGADNTSEKRKGFDALVSALRLAMENAEFAGAVNRGRVRFVSFGAARGAAPSGFPVPVTALGRIESEERLAALYAAADVFILPSLEDNLPNVLLESMACGTPAIAHQVGGIPDLVEHNVNGVLVPVGDSGAMAQAIVRMWSDAELRAACARNASRVRDTHALGIQAESYARLYQSLAANPPARFAKPEVRRFLKTGPETSDLFPQLLRVAKRRERWSRVARLFQWRTPGEAEEAPS